MIRRRAQHQTSPEQILAEAQGEALKTLAQAVFRGMCSPSPEWRANALELAAIFERITSSANAPAPAYPPVDEPDFPQVTETPRD